MKQVKNRENQRLDDLLKIVLKEALACKIPFSKNISENVYINKRAKKRYGACKLENIKGRKKYIIEVSSFVLDADDQTIKGIIAHEVLHTCHGCMNHGERWKRYASILNRAYGYNIKRVATREENNLPKENIGVAKPKYAIKCQNCGNIIYRMRMSKVIKNPERYRCKCGGKLEVFVVK